MKNFGISGIKRLKIATSITILLCALILIFSGCGSPLTNSEDRACPKVVSQTKEMSADAAILDSTLTPAAVSSNNQIASGKGIINVTENTAEKAAENSTENISKNAAESSADAQKAVAQNDGKPAPVEPQNIKIDKNTKNYCTILISGKSILDNMDKLDASKKEVLPDDGVILKTTKVQFYEGESVFDVLQRTTKEKKIHMEFVKTPLHNSSYIEGIGNIYEFDCGELSGWMYKVNDWFPNYGCSRYQLSDGDTIEWVFTCDLGKDVDGDYNAQKGGDK